MRIQVVTHPEYRQLHDELTLLPQHFEEEGTIVYQGRNLIKALRIGDTLRNVKSFKIPHWLNRFVYAYFRPSKAKRSFTYANLLLAKGIGTPCPIAYLVERSFWGIRRSYYVSEQVAFDYEFRDLQLPGEYPYPTEGRRLPILSGRFKPHEVQTHYSLQGIKKFLPAKCHR